MFPEELKSFIFPDWTKGKLPMANCLSKKYGDALCVCYQSSPTLPEMIQYLSPAHLVAETSESFLHYLTPTPANKSLGLEGTVRASSRSREVFGL